jgi:hypothetical protein
VLINDVFDGDEKNVMFDTFVVWSGFKYVERVIAVNGSSFGKIAVILLFFATYKLVLLRVDERGNHNLV